MKKGFTLIEIIAVVGIIGMIMLISIPLISNQIGNRKKELSDTTIKVVYSAADIYLNDNIIKFPKSVGAVYCIKIEDLTNAGYLKAPLKDIETGNEINLDKTLRAEVNEYKNYEIQESNNCAEKDTSPPTLRLVVIHKTTNSVTVNAIAKDTQSKIVKYEFSIDDGPYIDTGVTTNYQFKNVKTGTHTVNVRVTNEVGLKTEKSIEISPNEIEKPTCTITPSGWARSKVLKIIYPERQTDFVYTYKIDDNSWEPLSSGLVKEITFTEPGNVIAKIDDGTNYVESVTCQVAQIDTTPPTCTNSGDSTTWTGGNRVITKGCSDTQSGCATANTTQTFSSTTTTSVIPAYTITDKVGNSTTCPARTANVYVDKTAPTCTNSGDSTAWTGGNRVITKGCSDTQSGCATANTTQTFSSTTTTSVIAAYTIKDKVGNSRTCPARAASIYVDKTLPVCSVTQSGTNMNLSYSDAHSGINNYGMSTGATVTYNSVKTMAGIHNTRFYGFVRDKAGNTQSCSGVANIACNKLTTWNIGTQYKALNKATIAGQSGFQITSVSVASATTTSAVVNINWRLDVYNAQSYILSRSRNLCLSQNHADCDTGRVEIKNIYTQWGPGPFATTGTVQLSVSLNTNYKVKVYEGTCSAPSCSNYLGEHFTYETGDILRVACS